MARQINYEKLEAIKQSTMELVALNGNQKTTISMIAKHAGVSAGYLYTHFSSKDALIDELIHDTFLDIYSKLIKSKRKDENVESQISDFLLSLMNMVNEEPIKARFITFLAHDERLIKEFVMEDSLGIFEIANTILTEGKAQGVFRQDLIREELLLMLLNLPISSMYYSFIGNRGSEFYSEMQRRIARLCLSALG